VLLIWRKSPRTFLTALGVLQNTLQHPLHFATGKMVAAGGYIHSHLDSFNAKGPQGGPFHSFRNFTKRLFKLAVLKKHLLWLALFLVY
jgi:hypothetical protein